jgi:hypothetical protein
MQKVQIKVKETVSKNIEVEMPCYYVKCGMLIAITEHHVIQVSDSAGFIALIKSSESKRYADAIVDAMDWSKPTTQNDFNIAFDKCIKCLTEQYRSSIAMDNGYIEPKDGQQAEGTKGQPADNTQAADDKAPEEKEGAGALVD